METCPVCGESYIAKLEIDGTWDLEMNTGTVHTTKLTPDATLYFHAG